MKVKPKWPETRSTDWLVLLVLFAGALFIRLYRLPEAYFHFDEFSALFRTGFTRFSELIQKGVMETDTHPAGVQVFLNYWVMLTGWNETLIKLPFVLAGLIAIWQGYRLGRDWVHPTAGLFIAAFLAFSQYTLTWTLLARPYATGLLFSILLALSWDKAFLHNKPPGLKQIALYIFWGTLCAYNHHFTLFFLGLAVVTGLFAVRRKYLPKYLLANVTIFILYIPHLPVFFAQLKKGGVESWLHKPDLSFFSHYAGYIFHYSWLPALLFIAVIAYTFKWKGIPRHVMRYRIIAFSWVFVTWMVAWFYSVYRSAVLQFSVLIFVFPFLMIFLFSFTRDPGRRFRAVVVPLFAVLMVFTLYTNRDWERVFYHSGYKEMVEEAAAVLKNDSATGHRTSIVMDIPGHILHYYMKKVHLPEERVLEAEQFESIRDFLAFTDTVQADRILFGRSTVARLTYDLAVQHRFPVLIRQKNWFLCSLRLWSKDSDSPGLDLNSDEIIKYQAQYHDVNTDNEYFPVTELDLDSIAGYIHDEILLVAKVMLQSDPGRLTLVTEFRDGQELLRWDGTSIADFYHPGGDTVTVYHALMPSFVFRADKIHELKIYFWNPEQINFAPLNLTLKVYPGNRWQYALYEPVGNMKQ